jgi:glutathione synthase/RimK-type ligase-like ATP-grasp enzyme
MLIAIHHRKGSFSDQWIEYCDSNSIEYKLVNAYDNNIIEQIKDCDIFMWHHHHARTSDVLFSKQLLLSIEYRGIKVFPNYKTCWYFDDKIGQKYLLESIEAPFVPTYIFYDKKDALDWVDKTSFPKVFKLSRGAGAKNVRLIKNKKKARSLVKKAFGAGFKQSNAFGDIKDRWLRYRNKKKSILHVFAGVYQIFVKPEFARKFHNEKNYIYFQDFLPKNEYDIRIIVIGNKAFGIKRLVRKNDFRASGSGNIIYKKEEIDTRCINIAFDVNKKLNSQCIAFDFVFDKQNNPLIIEISYGFTTSGYDACEGYWDEKLNWFEGHFNPQAWMIENLINEFQNENINMR